MKLHSEADSQKPWQVCPDHHKLKFYGGRFGLSEQSLHVLDDQRIGLDKVPKFSVGGSLSEQSCPVRAVIYHGGNIVHDGVRHAVYACHVLQGGFQFHRGKGAGGKDTLAAVRVVPFFQVILDLLPPVGGIVDIYIRLTGGRNVRPPQVLSPRTNPLR